jgi:oligopeptide transport system substrate-binding protein
MMKPSARLRPVGLAGLVVAALLIGSVAGGTAARAETSATAASSATPGVLRIAQADPPDAFDPATLGDNRSIELAQNVFDGLTAVNDRLRVVPALARSWRVSRDGRTYTFRLRRGLRFQDGTPVTAQDVVYSLNRTLSPKTGSGYVFFLSVIRGAQQVNEGKAQAASGIRAIGRDTVRITLTQPAGYFLALSGMWPYWTVSRATVDRYGKGWVNPPRTNGTGAFRLTRVVGDSEYRFEANPRYFRGRPRVNRVEVSIVPDPSAQLARYRAGEFDVIYNLSAATYRQVQGDSTLRRQFRSRPLLRTTWINMRNDRPPFNDRRVRVAFNQAIDKNALVRIALGGLGSPAYTFLPPGLPGSVAAFRKPYQYNVARARELLSQAGFPNGQNFPRIDLHYPSAAQNQTVFEFVQGQLRTNLNVQIGLRPMPIKAYNALLADAQRRPLLSQYSFGLDYPDPQEQHEYLGVSQPAGFANYANYSNRRFDNLVRRANRTTSQQARYRLHRQAENIFLNDAPIVPLYHPLATWLAKPYVRGFSITPLYQRRWANVSVNP